MYKKQNTNKTKDYHDIFDRAFKRIITLSGPAVIRMINSMFEKDYPLDSEVFYNWTEFVKDDLNRKLADTIITINGTDRYHIEAQMNNDKTIIFRMLEYGFADAIRNWNHLPEKNYSNLILEFPKQRIIYLYHETPVDEILNVTLKFEDNKAYEYSIKTIDFISESIEEINNKNLIILIPFALLKLRKTFYEARTKENVEALKTLFWDDIIGSINKNEELGNITDVDAVMLKDICIKLFDHIYSDYEESEEVLNMRDHSLVLEIDPYVDRMEAAEAKSKELEEKIKEEEAKNRELEAELAALKAKLAEK